MDIQTAIARVVSGQSLLRSDMESVIRTVMQGEATEAQIGGLLVGLRMKGETIDEIVGAAAVMRALATPVSIGTDGLIDLAGTGGDGANLFNVSTAATFVVAAAGGRIAKHGNRSVSSSSGSSDVLSALGVNLAVTPDAIADCIDALGVGFVEIGDAAKRGEAAAIVKAQAHFVAGLATGRVVRSPWRSAHCRASRSMRASRRASAATRRAHGSSSSPQPTTTPWTACARSATTSANSARSLRAAPST